MNAKKARGDIILYGIFTVVGVIFYKWIIPTQIYMSKTASAEPFSPDTFPNAVTILFILASLAGLILAIYHYCKAVKAEGKPVREPVVRTRRETVGLFIPFIIFADPGVCGAVHPDRVHPRYGHRAPGDPVRGGVQKVELLRDLLCVCRSDVPAVPVCPAGPHSLRGRADHECITKYFHRR